MNIFLLVCCNTKPNQAVQWLQIRLMLAIPLQIIQKSVMHLLLLDSLMKELVFIFNSLLLIA